MKFSELLKSKAYKKFMSKLYGIGASIVIVGALFKITHIKGADIMLFVGLLTEATIFFFSAFEPPYVEPDWSLVYPQLAGIYHTPEEIELMKEQGLLPEEEGLTSELDKMLKNANIEEDLIQSLGNGLKNLNKTLQNLNEVSGVALASNDFINTIKSVNQSASRLGIAYQQTAEALETESRFAQDHAQNLKNVAHHSAGLNAAYTQIEESLKHETEQRAKLSENLAQASASAALLIEKYTASAESLQKATQALQFNPEDNQSYKEQLSRITRNMASLNAIYEMQLKASEENTQTMNTSIQAFSNFLNKLRSTAEITGHFGQNVAALNQAIEAQISGTTGQVQKSAELQKAYDSLLQQLQATIENTQKYQQQADQLSKNMAALNNIYGNMLSAMTSFKA